MNSKHIPLTIQKYDITNRLELPKLKVDKRDSGLMNIDSSACTAEENIQDAQQKGHFSKATRVSSNHVALRDACYFTREPPQADTDHIEYVLEMKLQKLCETWQEHNFTSSSVASFSEFQEPVYPHPKRRDVEHLSSKSKIKFPKYKVSCGKRHQKLSQLKMYEENR